MRNGLRNVYPLADDGDLGSICQISGTQTAILGCTAAIWITGGPLGSAEGPDPAIRTPVFPALAAPLPLSLPPLPDSLQEKAQLHPPRRLSSAVVALAASCRWRRSLVRYRNWPTLPAVYR